MAVSMLAGCKSGTTNPNPGEGEGEGNTATGYSAMLGEKAADDLYKSDRDGIFTFADNADDQKALEYVVSHKIDQNNVKDIITGDYVNSRDNAWVNSLWDAFIKKTEITYGINGGLKGQHSVNSTRFAEFYVANGDVDMDTVLDEIYEDVKGDFTSAAKEGKESGIVKVNYSYTVSVSVKNVPMTVYTDMNGSANFIAVTVTRTAEIA